jgi:hypothetical protein
MPILPVRFPAAGTCRNHLNRYPSLLAALRSAWVCQLLVISAVLLSASLACGAQKMRGMDKKPASTLPDQASIQQMTHVLPTTLRPMRAAVGTAVHSQPQALQPGPDRSK